MNLPVPVQRLGYRLAHRCLRMYWLLFRPHVSGVKCVLTHGEDVLLVRHTYGPRSWDLPGGTPRRGEPPEIAATREMHEELGVTVDAWRFLGRLEVDIYHKRDTLHCFQAEMSTPEVVLDLGELSTAEWFPAGALPNDLGRYTRAILRRT